MLRLVFCFFPASMSVSVSGLSIPTKTVKKFARRSRSSSSSSSARLIDASVANSNGQPRTWSQRVRCGRNCFSAFLLPGEIVVDELDHPAPPEAVECAQLGQHLII